MTVAMAVKKIIPLARAIQDYWDAELPKRHPKYPLVDPDADDGPPGRRESFPIGDTLG